MEELFIRVLNDRQKPVAGSDPVAEHQLQSERRASLNVYNVAGRSQEHSGGKTRNDCAAQGRGLLFPWLMGKLLHEELI